MIGASKKQKKKLLNLFSDKIMNFNKVMPIKMKNSVVKQPGLDGDKRLIRPEKGEILVTRRKMKKRTY